MIIYRDASDWESTREKLRRAVRLASSHRALEFLVELGELEQGIADALSPRRDHFTHTERRLRAASLESGRAFLAAHSGRTPSPHLKAARALLDDIRGHPLPARIRIHPPEGYAHYALDPAGYAAAAESYREDVGAGHASRAVVIGVRSIGTSLSGVVAATLGADRTVTIRPRGESGSRRIAADPVVESIVHERGDGADVLIVDEGPGATGETFAIAAEWVRGIGVPDARIVLIPSRGWGMPLAPEERQDWFYGARKYLPAAADLRPAGIAGKHGYDEPENLSAGLWRNVVADAFGQPANVPHERVKYRLRSDGSATSSPNHDCLLRYAGLGRNGRMAVERAERLAAAGVGPDVVACMNEVDGAGFMLRAWIDGRPLTRGTRVRRPLFGAIEQYLSGRTGRFGTGRAVDTEPLILMLTANATESLGDGGGGTGSGGRGRGERGLNAAVERLLTLPAREANVPDARMQPYEWLRTARGFAKVDGMDHGTGLRLPGPTDAAWDLAGAAVEFGLDRAAVQPLVHACARAGGDDPVVLRQATIAYRAPYAAACLGDAFLSAHEATSDEDRRRLEGEAAFYRGVLREELARAR